MRNDNMKTQRVWCLDKIQQSLIYTAIIKAKSPPDADLYRTHLI